MPSNRALFLWQMGLKSPLRTVLCDRMNKVPVGGAS